MADSFQMPSAPEGSTPVQNIDTGSPAYQGLTVAAGLAQKYQEYQKAQQDMQQAQETHKLSVMKYATDALINAVNYTGPAAKAEKAKAQQALQIVGVAMDPNFDAYAKEFHNQVHEAMLSIAQNPDVTKDPEGWARATEVFSNPGMESAKSFMDYVKTTQDTKVKSNATIVAAKYREQAVLGLPAAKIGAGLHGAQQIDALTDDKGNPLPDDVKENLKRAALPGYAASADRAKGLEIREQSVQDREDRFDRQQVVHVVDRLTKAPEIRKQLQIAWQLDRALNLMEQATVNPQLIEDAQQTMLGALGIGAGGGTGNERSRRYINDIGLNWDRLVQFATGKIRAEDPNDPIIKWVKNNIHIEAAKANEQLLRRLEPLAKGAGQSFKNPRIGKDLREEFDAFMGNLQGSIPGAGSKAQVEKKPQDQTQQTPPAAPSGQPGAGAAPAQAAASHAPSPELLDQLKSIYKGDLNRVRAKLQQNGFDTSGVQ